MSDYRSVWKIAQGCLAVTFLTLMLGCSTAPKSADTTTPSEPPSVKKIPAGQEFSGFLKNYEQLKPNENLGGNALTYAGTDARNNLRSYFAIVVDPIEVYVATDTDASKVDEDARATLTNYFHHALLAAVSDAFPPVDKPGPLTLRLRAALVGVDVGGQVAAADVKDAQPLKQAMNIGKVQVEMELVDSMTGERIAAMVDRSNLGAGAEVGAKEFSRVEKFAAAREAFDEWASRVREFLDSAHELTGADAERADKSYRPYQ